MLCHESWLANGINVLSFDIVLNGLLNDDDLVVMKHVLSMKLAKNLLYECCLALLVGVIQIGVENWLKPSLHCATRPGHTGVPCGRVCKAVTS